MSELQRNTIYTHLQAHSAHLPNGEWVGHMLASLYADISHMPMQLGLSVEAYQKLLARHFPGATLPTAPHFIYITPDMPEREDLFSLLMSHSNSAEEDAEWIATIIVTGCSGNNHLWQDLGLWSRSELTQLLEYNFPSLAVKNDQNMKWKKFFYKQLCLQEGIYICRAPSCAVCIDYNNCFGSEE